jgi:hypothetical protein
MILQGGADEFLMGGDLTLNQIRTLSTTSQRSAVSLASAASMGSNGPAADDREQAVGASSVAVQSIEVEEMNARGQGTESLGRRKVPGIPSVSPRPRTTMSRTPNGRAKDPSSPPKRKRTQSKPESPPPFRAGGSAKSSAARRAPVAASGARRTPTAQTPSRSASSVMAREMSTKSSMRTTAGTGGVAAAKASTPTSTQQRPQWGVNPASNNRRKAATPTTSTTSTTGTTSSRRTIAKPPENIKRAIKESQLLTDSLDSKEDSEMQNLKEILNDIKTIKTELGVESANGKTEEGIEGAVDGDAVAGGEAESANTMPSPRDTASDAATRKSVDKSPRKSVDKSPRKSVDKSPRKSVDKSPRKSPRDTNAVLNSPIKVPDKTTQETSMDDSADILGALDGIQDEDATFLDDSKKVTDELDEVSGPSYAKMEEAAEKVQKVQKGDQSKTCVPCCSVM